MADIDRKKQVLDGAQIDRDQPEGVPFLQTADAVERRTTFSPEAKHEMLELFEVISRNNFDKTNPWGSLFALAENHRNLFGGALLKDAEVIRKAREVANELVIRGDKDRASEMRRIFFLELPN